MTQISFSTAWGWQGDRATREHRPFKSDAEARAMRDQAYRDAKRGGLKVSRSSMSGQLRKYWGLMDPCGEVCTVYYLHIDDYA